VKFSPVMPGESSLSGVDDSSSGGSIPGMGRYRGLPGLRGMQAPVAPVAPVATAPPGQGDVISTITVHCCGVNRLDLSPSANSDLAYAVLQDLTNSDFFTDKSKLGDYKEIDEGSNTFSFSLTVELKHPFKFKL